MVKLKTTENKEKLIHVDMEKIYPENTIAIGTDFPLNSKLYSRNSLSKFDKLLQQIWQEKQAKQLFRSGA